MLKSIIMASIILVLLSMPTLASAASSKPAIGGPIISSVSDQAGDVDNSYGYIDMIQANIRKCLPNPVIKSGMLIFEMIVKDQIPRNPYPGINYHWLIDADMDSSTGEPHVIVGSEYNIRVSFEEGRWKGWVDAFSGIPASPCQVSVKSNTIRITVQLSQIGYPTHFNWAIWTHITPPSTPTIVSDDPDSYAICLL